MERRNFLSLLGFSFLIPSYPKFKTSRFMQPEQIFFNDDGIIPNNKLPLLLYRDVFSERNSEGAEWLENRFAENGWTNSWRNGVYNFHHYHSTTHEVLGIYSGEALLHLGGEQGQKIKVKAGDIIIIPAGVGHKNIDSADLGVVGAYPEGKSWDLMRGVAGERPQADKNIASLSVPSTDPFQGKTAGLNQIWK